MASAVIGALRVNLGIDSAEFSDGLAKVRGSLNKLGPSLAKWGAGLTAAVTTPLVAIGKGMIDAASDAAESASAFDFLFKEQAVATRKWADETAKALGRSTYALQEQALAFQQYFSQVAPTNDQAAELSRNFTQLAQDLASFYNVTESDALQKLRSGLAGEAEPMRAFGVFMSAAAVEAKALEMGLTGANDELTEQEKVLARAALIMEQTSAAQGDAARTAGSFANQQKALSAALQDVGIKLGTILLPFVQQAVSALSGLVRWFSELSPRTQEWIVIAGGMAAALGPALIALGALAAGIAAIGLPVAAAIAGVAALTAAVVAFWPEIVAAKDAVVGFANEGVARLSEMIERVKGFAAELVAAFTALPGQMLEIGRNIIDGLWRGIQEKWEAVKAGIANIGTSIADSVRSTLGIQSPSKVMHDIGVNIMQGLSNGIDSMTGQVTGGVTSVADSIGSAFSGIGSSISGAIEGTKSWKDVALDAIQSIGKAILANMNFGGGLAGGLFKGLLGGLLGFANGGSFTVGGAGGVDSQLVAFKASPNEQVSVTKPGQESGSNVHVTVGVAADNNGNLMPFVQSVSQREAAGIVQAATPGIVKGSVTAVQQTSRNKPGFFR